MSDPTVAGSAIYHRVRETEDHDVSANIIWNLVVDAVKRNPESRRILYLDIDGHRNPAGGWDADMVDLQQQFIIGMLMPFLTEANIPLGRITNPNIQNNDMPEVLQIGDGRQMLEKAVGSYDRALLDRAYTRVTGKTTADMADNLVEGLVGQIVFGSDRKLADQMVEAIRRIRSD